MLMKVRIIILLTKLNPSPFSAQMYYFPADIL
jgi:hypothetical protein